MADVAATLGAQAMEAHTAREEAKSREVWLHAWHDPVAGLKAFSPCVRLADLNGDGDQKLLVAGSDRKLRIYKGTSLLSENILLDAPVRGLPWRRPGLAAQPVLCALRAFLHNCATHPRPLHPQVAIAVFHPEARKGTVPSVAVASGQYVFIYRNLRPYYKFILPTLDVDATEV